jgi:hypothetical protein
MLCNAPERGWQDGDRAWRARPEAFIAACDRFIFLEVLRRLTEAAARVQVADVPDLQDLLRTPSETAQDSGWAPLCRQWGR